MQRNGEERSRVDLKCKAKALQRKAVQRQGAYMQDAHMKGDD